MRIKNIAQILMTTSLFALTVGGISFTALASGDLKEMDPTIRPPQSSPWAFLGRHPWGGASTAPALTASGSSSGAAAPDDGPPIPGGDDWRENSSISFDGEEVEVPTKVSAALGALSLGTETPIFTLKGVTPLGQVRISGDAIMNIYPNLIYHYMKQKSQRMLPGDKLDLGLGYTYNMLIITDSIGTVLWKNPTLVTKD